MTSQQFLGRELGLTRPESLEQSVSTHLLYALQANPHCKFDGAPAAPAASTQTSASADTSTVWAHRAGVNALTIEKFESRFLLTGGADGSLGLWDLTACRTPEQPTAASPLIHHALDVLPKSPHNHQFGITHLSWFPFDPYAFLSSSYDHRLNLYATPTFSSASTPAATFTLPGVIHSHALSSIASHLLVACATGHPAVRLIDLKSNAATHALSGHNGAVMSVAWSPRHEHILASAGADGSVRLWDIRRSAASLGTLDMDDTEGVLGVMTSGNTNHVPSKNSPNRRAHVGACNGLAWTDSGDFLVTAGHDARIRVFDMATGANTLAHFGPRIRNNVLNAVLPVIVPEAVTGPGREVLLFPSGEDILMCNLREGDLITRLKVKGSRRGDKGGGGGSGGRGLVKSVSWREGHCEAYSAHADGVVRAWWPRTDEDVEADQEEEEEEEHRKEADESSEENKRKRKREALDQVFQDLTRQKITFT